MRVVVDILTPILSADTESVPTATLERARFDEFAIESIWSCSGQGVGRNVEADCTGGGLIQDDHERTVIERFRQTQVQPSPTWAAVVVCVQLGQLVSGGGTAAAAQSSPEPTEPSGFASCTASVSSRPDEYESYLCFYREALRTGQFDEAVGLLEEQRSGSSVAAGAAAGRSDGDLRGGWSALVLGFLVQAESSERALGLYEASATAFGRAGLSRGEVLARANARHLLVRLGDLDAASDQVERAVAAARGTDDGEALARAAILEARHLVELGIDLGRAERALQRASLQLFPGGSASLRRSALFTQGQLDSRLGRHEDAADAYERYLHVLAETGDSFNLANVRFNIGHELMLLAKQDPERVRLAEIISVIERALDEAIVQDAVDAEVRALGLLSELERFQDPERAREMAHRCRSRSEELGRPELIIACAWAEALLPATATEDALAASDRAIATSIDADFDHLLALSRMVRVRLDWQHLEPAEAARRSMTSLAAIEALRSAQVEPMARARWFTNWTHDYRWLVGKLYEEEDPDIALAFEVGERLRARVLLDQVARSSQRPSTAVEPSSREREIGEAIASIQRQLLDPRLESGARDQALRRLEELELEDADQRFRAIEEGRSITLSAETDIASLEDVQIALGPTEALLVYHLGPWKDYLGQFGGGSWLTVVTADTARVVRLPSARDVEAAVPIFEGLFERRDGMELSVGDTLAADVLRPALEPLPSEVDRLIVVPDGVLQRLPLDALTSSPGVRVGESHRVELAPSASVWLRWRQAHLASAGQQAVGARGRRIAGDRALVLADPDFESVLESAAVARERNLVLAEGMTLGRLPHARREGRAIVRRLGRSRGTVLEGGEASEQQFKRLASTGGLDDYGLLHFAAHAVSDTQHPHRSAIVLASDDDTEDGLLQPREIAQLSLHGQLVVLSACRTADGALLRGEGPMSLARVFLEAGASAVIGTRWPLRDDEGEWLFARFYEGLAEGLDVSSALREVKRQAIAAGMPAASWAGLVLIGDGAKKLAIEGTAQRPPRWLSASSLAIATTLVFGASAAVLLVKLASARRG